MMEFEVFTDDPAVVELIEKYWAIDNSGKYLHNVSALLPFRDISSMPKLISFINEESRAWNPESRCPICECSALIRSRADRLMKTSSKPTLCIHCAEKQEAEKIKKLAREQQMLDTVLQNVLESTRNRKIEYSQISDDVALIVLAIERAICPKLLNDSFEASDLRFLINGSIFPLLERLINANVIALDHANARPGAFWLKDVELWYDMTKTRFFLVPDKTYGSSESALAYLNNRPWDKSAQMRTLWLDYSTAECLTYFFAQCDRYSLYPNPDDIDNITSQIRAALEQYSIQKLWCALWTIVKDAAALCNHKFYNQAKATATMPGKLKRLFEAVRKEQRQPLKAWDRPHDQPAGTIGDLFFEKFGVSEATPGHYAMQLFANPTPPPHDAFMKSLIFKNGGLDQVIEYIHKQKSGAESLAQFAAGIKEGLSIDDAILKMIQNFPDFPEDMDQAG